jgi:hypothetical protein
MVRKDFNFHSNNFSNGLLISKVTNCLIKWLEQCTILNVNAKGVMIGSQKYCLIKTFDLKWTSSVFPRFIIGYLTVMIHLLSTYFSHLITFQINNPFEKLKTIGDFWYQLTRYLPTQEVIITSAIGLGNYNFFWVDKPLFQPYEKSLICTLKGN